MKRIIACGILLIGFLIISCDLELKPGGNTKFTSDLQGTWVTSDQYERYQGTLVINTNQITITGFSEYPPYYGYNDNERPFRDFTRTGYPFNGYSEAGEKGNGKIFIQYRGEWQDGIPYYYEATGYPTYVNLLYFTFGGREQVMVKQM